MKKQVGIFTAVASLLFLAGCQTSNSSSKNADSSKSSLVKKSSTKKSASAGSQAPDGVKKTRFGKVNAEISKEVSNMPLPQASGIKKGANKINACYVKDKNKTTIYYSVGTKPKAVNNASVKKELPYLVYTQESGLSKSKITEAINYQESSQGLPTVKLNNGVKATQQSGAGQTYLTWTKNNWSFTVQASSVNGQDPKETANKLVALLEDYELPTKEGKASIMIKVGESYGSLNNRMTFETNGKLYTIKAHSLKTMLKSVSTINF